MGLESIPQAVRDRYHIEERGHASAILASDYPNEFKDIQEKSFDIQITIDGNPVPIPTHKIDDFKNEVGLEVEWNNKTEFYDRDLNNFRLLNVGTLRGRKDEVLLEAS